MPEKYMALPDAEIFALLSHMLSAKRGEDNMKWQVQSSNPHIRCYPTQGNKVLQVIGLLLIACGLLLLFLCIPGWAWAAFAGIVLIAAGYLLLRLNGCFGR